MYDEVYYTSEIAERTLNIQNMKSGPLPHLHGMKRALFRHPRGGGEAVGPNDPRDVFMTN